MIHVYTLVSTHMAQILANIFSPPMLSMLYKQDIFLQKYCKRVKEEPFSWNELLKPIRFELPKNSIIDLSSLKPVM